MTMMFPNPLVYYYDDPNIGYRDVTSKVMPRALHRAIFGSSFSFRCNDSRQFIPRVGGWIKLISGINGAILFLGKITQVSVDSSSIACECNAESPLMFGAKQQIRDINRTILRYAYSVEKDSGYASAPALFSYHGLNVTRTYIAMLRNLWALLTYSSGVQPHIVIDDDVRANISDWGKRASVFRWPITLHDSNTYYILYKEQALYPFAITDPYQMTIEDLLMNIAIIGRAIPIELYSNDKWVLWYRSLGSSSKSIVVGSNPQVSWAAQNPPVNATALTISISRPEIDEIAVSCPLVVLFTLSNYCSTKASAMISGSPITYYPYMGLVPVWKAQAAPNWTQPPGTNTPPSLAYYGPGVVTIGETAPLVADYTGAETLNICSIPNSLTSFAIANPEIGKHNPNYAGICTTYRLPSWLKTIGSPTEIKFTDGVRIGGVVCAIGQYNTDPTNNNIGFAIGQVEDAKIELVEHGGGQELMISLPLADACKANYGAFPYYYPRPILFTVPIMIKNMRVYVIKRLTQKQSTHPTFYRMTIKRDDMPIVITSYRFAYVIVEEQQGGARKIVDELAYLPFDCASFGVVDNAPVMFPDPEVIPADINTLGSSFLDAFVSNISYTTFPIKATMDAQEEKAPQWSICTVYKELFGTKPLIFRLADPNIWQSLPSNFNGVYEELGQSYEAYRILDQLQIADGLLNSIASITSGHGFTAQASIAEYDESVRPGYLANIIDQTGAGQRYGYYDTVTLDFENARVSASVTSDPFNVDQLQKFYTVSQGEPYYARTTTFST